MTKEVLADWIHVDMPVNPFLPRYRRRKVIVEFDLYGEYWGRLDLPACYPEYIHRQIRTIKSFDVCGAVGRAVHENERSPVFRTIFESSNEVNCYAFSRLLSEPLPWLGPGQVTDPREKQGRWGWDVDAFDKNIWMDWASRRYGRKAAVPLIRAFSRTYRILGLVTDIGGRRFQAHSWVPGACWVPFLWEPFVDQVRMLGMDFLRDEKREATRMAGCCLEDVRAAERELSKEDYEKLTAVFEGEILLFGLIRLFWKVTTRSILRSRAKAGAGWKQRRTPSPHLPSRYHTAEARRSSGPCPIRFERWANLFGRVSRLRGSQAVETK